MRLMQTSLFHPVVADWFTAKYSQPTEPQARGWPAIASGQNTLIAAPTGSGKTFTAFLVAIDQLFRKAIAGDLQRRTEILYISPLKALSNDIERNLREPLTEILALAKERGYDIPPIHAAVRTGDTPAHLRQALIKKPPHILVTTPESLYLMLTSERPRQTLANVKTVIVDEIHALARDKRGSHLTLSLERLTSLVGESPQRIGLSATQRPLDRIAKFLTGKTDSLFPCEIIDAGHTRDLDLGIETPLEEYACVCSAEDWEVVYQRLIELIESHRSTLIFVNTRRLAERLSYRLTQLLGKDHVAGHHGSLAKETRLAAEVALKEGRLKAIVATSSLEMGIDIGHVDLVCQINSPRSIAALLQRVGRSGHSLGKTPKGRLFPLTRDELLEAMALVRGVKRGQLDAVIIPQQPLDILTQQIVAELACEPRTLDELFQQVRRADPYADLTREEFDRVIKMLEDGVDPRTRRGAWLMRDPASNQLRAKKGARLRALLSGGAIPEKGEIRVVMEDGTFVGSVDEDFAIDSVGGDIFHLGNQSLRIIFFRGNELTVQDAKGAPASIPFWFGEGPGRTIELCDVLSELRDDMANVVREGSSHFKIQEECGLSLHGIEQAMAYIAAQIAAVGAVATTKRVVFERFFDDAGGMQLVVHAPFGSRVTRPWGLSLRKRFCRSFDFELQAAAIDNGLLLSMGPQHSLPLDNLAKLLHPRQAMEILEQAIIVAPVFQTRWRHNVTRALAVARSNGGKRVPIFLQKFRSDDLLAAAFPETVGCLENHHGDVKVPDHPLVQQTMRDCMLEAMDAPQWMKALNALFDGGIEIVLAETREPSPMAHELLNANPYAFLDDAPLEERRTRAVSTRRSLGSREIDDLARLDAPAIDEVTLEAWPEARNIDELEEALQDLVALPACEAEPWRFLLLDLQSQDRAMLMRVSDEVSLWFSPTRLPIFASLFPTGHYEPSASFEWTPIESHVALVELLRGQILHRGPKTASQYAALLGLESSTIHAGLEALEGEGLVMRGVYDGRIKSLQENGSPEAQWCERRLLSRIHRRTIERLREKIQPVSSGDFIRFLFEHQRVATAGHPAPVSAGEVIELLEGWEAPAAAWEGALIPVRLSEYDSSQLDALFLEGELLWGRLGQINKEDASAATLSRASQLSIFRRQSLAWLLPPREFAQSIESISGAAKDIVDALSTKGALFPAELRQQASLLPAQLDDALRELAGAGLATSDSFSAVRRLFALSSASARARKHAALAPGGRWSAFPPNIAPVEKIDRLTAWCHTLLRRWGVICRDIIQLEKHAPPWRELHSILRRLEARGEVRGGRFVSGIAGEQFALEQSISALRAVRDNPPASQPVVLSACDPLNVFGLLDDSPRVPASHRNFLLVEDGRLVATFVPSREGDPVVFHEERSPIERAELTRGLLRGRIALPNDEPIAETSSEASF
jgi:ATP-dependent helicase Lhr and Lhr-like helicase